MNDTLEYIIKKYNINPGRQYIIDIPNMGRNDLAALFAELGFKKGVEIGVEKGNYSEILLKANPKLHLYSIDPWRASAYEPDIEGVEKRQRKFDEYYKGAKKRLSAYNCTVIRKESLAALYGFDDNSLDFVYIDANHDFVNFTNDIHYWLKKIRVGGIVSGHDYAYFPSWKHNHVKRALQAYTRSYRMIPLFIVGGEAVRQPGIIRDPFRSWFWVKR